MIKVKCISPRLNHIHFFKDATGGRSPRKIQVGETFMVKGIPPEWVGLVIDVGDAGKKDITAPLPADDEDPEDKDPATNPAEGAVGSPDQFDLEALRADYLETTGDAAPKNWGVKKLKQVLAKG